jgi:hypothetical protein
MGGDRPSAESHDEAVGLARGVDLSAWSEGIAEHMHLGHTSAKLSGELSERNAPAGEDDGVDSFDLHRKL